MGFKVKQSLTASQILTLIKTVDGVDSGLDSDFLRGKTPSQIVTENLIESDPTVSSFTKGLTNNNSVLAALNAASESISANRLPSSGVVPGTYNASATQVRPFTIDGTGRITAVGNLVTITPNWSSITEKPTTLSGYGITDAVISNSGGIGGASAITNVVTISRANYNLLTPNATTLYLILE